jgi:hypothetical protein
VLRSRRPFGCICSSDDIDSVVGGPNECMCNFLEVMGAAAASACASNFTKNPASNGALTSLPRNPLKEAVIAIESPAGTTTQKQINAFATAAKAFGWNYSTTARLTMGQRSLLL